MSKKIISVLLVLGLTAILGACGGGGGDTTAPDAGSPSPAESPSP